MPGLVPGIQSHSLRRLWLLFAQRYAEMKKEQPEGVQNTTIVIGAWVGFIYVRMCALPWIAGTSPAMTGKSMRWEGACPEHEKTPASGRLAGAVVGGRAIRPNKADYTE